MKNIKTILSLMMVFALTLGVVGCSSSKGEKISKLDEIKKEGKLVIGTSMDYPPYEFPVMENGKEKIVGFDMMLAEEVAKAIGVKLEIKSMQFDGLLGSLNAGEVDIVMASMTPTETRKKAVDFSDIYYEGKNVVVVNKGDEEILKDKDQLKNLKIGVQKDSVQESIVKELGATKMSSLPKVADALIDLKTKRVDAVVLGANVADLNIKRNSNLIIAKTDLVSTLGETSAVAFKKEEGNKELIDLVNKTIKELKDSGKIDKMMEKALVLSGE